jgi:hypothetical protein
MPEYHKDTPILELNQAFPRTNDVCRRVAYSGQRNLKSLSDN